MRRDLARSLVGQRPELPLEGTDRLLPRPVEELLLGLAFLALVDAMVPAPAHHLGPKGIGQPSGVVEDVLEPRRQMDLEIAAEFPEQLAAGAAWRCRCLSISDDGYLREGAVSF